jgi:hypothetical protein
MSNFTPVILSGSTDGLAVKVAATATLGTTIHTAVTGTTNIDEIYLYANNTSATAEKLTIEWGTGTAADGNIEQTIQPEEGIVLVIPRLRLQNAKVVTAFAGTANVILITGGVDRYTA